MTANALMSHPSFQPITSEFVPDANPFGTKLTDRSMNVDLTLRAWQAKKVNHKVSDEVTTQHKADKDAGRWETHLVPKKALDPITKAHSAARDRHYKLTLPWGQDGVRILAATAFFDYSAAMDAERQKCEAEYRKFVHWYPRLLADAPARLGAELYKASDFPNANFIAQRFGFELTIMPVPDRDDFRVNLGADVEQEIRANIEATVKARYAEAQKELWTRVLDTTRHFAQALGDPDKTFRDTTVTKLAELARIAPKLSLTPDDDFTELCAEVLKVTQIGAPQEYRDNAMLRSTAAMNARQALAKMEKAMEGAF